jgi:hypothetical protein
MNLGTMALQDNSSVVITGGTVTGLPTPTVATDAANKQYVDDTALGFTVHPAVKYATTTVLPNTPTYNNGSKTLTAGSNTTLTVDSSVVGSGERVLVKDQASSFQNGVYSLTAVGSGAAPWVLTRVSDFDTTATGEIKPGAFFAVTNGTLNAGSTWTMTSTVVTIGTDPIVFAQFSTGGTDVWAISGSDINFTTGKVGVGTATPASELNTVTSSTSTLRGITSDQTSSDTNSASINLRKIRGSSAVASGDGLGHIIPWGYDGTQYTSGGRIKFGAEGTIASNSVPTNIQFHTGNVSNGAEKMRIDSNGQVGIGTTSPSQNSYTWRRTKQADTHSLYGKKYYCWGYYSAQLL